MKKKENLFKFTGRWKYSVFVPDFRYPLALGEWTPPAEGELKLCRNGYHAITKDHLVGWMNYELYRVEYKGESVWDKEKVVLRQIQLVEQITTWNEKTMRLFAVHCAKQAIEICLRQPTNYLLDKILYTAEKYARGEVSKGELHNAWLLSRRVIEEEMAYRYPIKEKVYDAVSFICDTSPLVAAKYTSQLAAEAITLSQNRYLDYFGLEGLSFRTKWTFRQFSNDLAEMLGI